MNLVNYKKATFERNNLIISDDISLDEWKELGHGLKTLEGSIQFWIGDWLRFGEKKGFTGKYVSSESYDEAEKLTGYERTALKDYKYVSEKTSSVRTDDLSFGHHKQVTSQPPEIQKELLEKASEEKLTVKAMTFKICVCE